MKALIIKGYAGEERAVVEDVSTPAPGADEVLVKVRAAAANPLDVKLARGYLKDFFPLRLPYVLGTDLAGTIESVGERVTTFHPGEEVLARRETMQGGAFAERVVAPERLLVRAPRTLGVDEASAMGTAAATAWQALFEVAEISASTRLLVTGGAGSVGGMAVRLAASVGARVYATALAEDAGMAKSFGAETVFDARSKIDLKDLDLVFDTVGGDGQDALSRCCGTVGSWPRSRARPTPRRGARVACKPRSSSTRPTALALPSLRATARRGRSGR